jgi:DnaJ-class molecular chaperone
MINKLIQCEECFGTGEIIHKGKHSRPCKTCDGNGMTTLIRNEEYLKTINKYGTSL